MKNNTLKNTLQHFVLGILIILISMMGHRTYTEAINYEVQMQEYSDSQNIKDLTKENLKKKFSFSSWFSKKEDANTSSSENISKELPQQETSYAVALGFLVALMLLMFFFVPLKLFNIYSSVMIIIVLCYALVTPLMMVTIHKEISYIGDVVLSFESKSLVTSTAKLINSGDYVIGAAIILFSILVPVLKALSLFLIAVFEDNLFTHKLIGFFKAIGKWSMVDVFVVAVLLVFLSANKGDISKAEVEMGIYVFMCYVIASMIVSISASKMLKNIKYKG